MGIERDTGSWSFDSDVVVIGSGGCGLTAAIAAAQQGVEVIVLEKQQRPWSNTARSGGMIPAAATRFQRAAGIREPVDDFVADIMRKNHGASDPAMTRHLAHTATQLVEWLVDAVGVELVFIDDFKYPGHTEFRMHAPPSRTGAALVSDLRRSVASHPLAEIVNDAAATGLVVDGEGGVTGVIVQHGSQTERVRARKVILACNGFAGNPEMVAQYCPAMSGALYFGGEGNTGEGILWGMELGAATAYMDAYQAHASVATPHGILITYAVVMEGGFQINAHGRRFGNEWSGYSEHALAVLDQPGATAWNIYDARVHRLALQFEDYQQAVSVNAIHQAATVEELAAALKLPAAPLAQTLQEYNAVAAGEHSDPFGRPDCRKLAAPFYGVKVTGALFHTQGGLVVDFDARVAKPDGRPIPNLSAGGGVAAGVSGHGPGGYLSGNGLLTALGYGYLAGRHAAVSIRQAQENTHL
ncbi:MAG: FAD-dependent oxidoreductase [Caldilineaceae bacterium]|nr:FAD-dependent oxidoreductase [Caldilineaceae bacterium]